MRLKDLDTDIPYRTTNATYCKERFIKSFAKENVVHSTV